MSVFSNEENLPGVITEVEADYAYGYDTSQFGTTDSVAVIGTAFNGPVGTPVAIYSPEHAAYVFGKTYDTEKREEATLVAGIKDAWERGCRTIYGVRVGGKDLFKDFSFRVDNGYRLRVSSRFPSNGGKQCFLKYDNSAGNESIAFYKPAERATISQKKRGVVESDNSVIAVTLRLAQDYGFSRDTRLVDVIRLFNEHDDNNVIKISIVDTAGIDKTDATECYGIPLGALYPGVYFMGRDESACEQYTEIKFCAAGNNASAIPYSGFSEAYFRKLEFNTDVSLPVPIYADSSHMGKFRDVLKRVNIAMAKPYDFLEVSEMPDRAFPPDTSDYEEVVMSRFEMYKRLGSGFAITAKASRRETTDEFGNKTEATPRISETPMEDGANRVVPIVEGIYDVLQNAEIKYRVLTCAHADEEIDGRLPRAKDFQAAAAESLNVLENYMVLTPKVSDDDLTPARIYNVTFEDAKSAAVDQATDVYLDEVFSVAAHVKSADDINPAVIENGERILADNLSGNCELYRVSGNRLVNLTSPENAGQYIISDNRLYEGNADGTFSETAFPADSVTGEYYFEPKPGVRKQYILGAGLSTVFIFGIKSASDIEPLGDYATMMHFTEEDSSQIVAYAESLPCGHENLVKIRSAVFDAVTLEELVDLINRHPALSQLFRAELTEEGTIVKDDFVTEAVPRLSGSSLTYRLAADRKIGYDYSRYIPYRTTDNFVRQLAQHCTYTELKTTPTYGIIAWSRILDVGLSNLSRLVSEAVNSNFDLYAKTNFGRNMLDRNNYPYPIGKNVSVVFGQYNVTMDSDNYRFLSEGAAGYAGMVSTLPLDQSSTNQPIAIDETTFTLTTSQLKALTKAGIVTFRDSFTKGIVVTDGVTMAPVESVFRRLSASRIVGAVEDLLRQAAEPYIGKQNHTANRNSLYTAIKSNLEKIKGTLIEAYSFTMVEDPSIAKLSYIQINYQIVPVYEIREVRNQITIKDNTDGMFSSMA